MVENVLGRNITFPIYYDDNGTRRSFHDLVMQKATLESVVMSLGDKVTGDVYYKDNTLSMTMKEYILVDGVKYFLVNPPTIVREGTVSDNSQLKGMTKYAFVFYHPMYKLGNFPFTDIAVTSDEEVYLSQNKTFYWIGTLFDFIDKLNANLANSEWVVISNIAQSSDMWEKARRQSEVLTFDKQFISDALKAAYDTWDIPFIITPTTQVVNGVQKAFKIEFGLPVEDIYTTNDQNERVPFVFNFGQGVGLKNNSRTPRNNKIVTRIIGEGSERNIPYGYPQIRWYGSASAEYTYGSRAGVFTDVDITIGGVTHHLPKLVSYPVYKGILGGQWVALIKHPFTRKNLMPKEYHETVYNKICYINSNGTFNENYNPDIEIVDYIDAIGSTYAHEINPLSPSAEMHTFEDIKPELLVDEKYGFINVYPINDSDMQRAADWDDSIDDEGNYKQGYFKVRLPQLQFDLYACAAITENMQINMKSGACLGCTFDVEVDWDDYKNNFYKADGSFDPVIHTTTGDGHRRDGSKYPDSSQGQIEIILKKDTETFGTLKPNMYQHPKGESGVGEGDGDNFVVLGISLPESYIQSAEIKLSAEMELYMKDNNNYYYDYPLKFDEYFLATHTDILSQISNNKKVRFNYGGQEIALYIKQITIKYGESPLPKYDIVLTDNIEVVLNQIGQAVGEMRAISNTFFVANSDMRRELTRIENRVADDKKHGDIHRFYYYAGEWVDDNLQGNWVTDLEAPFFSYTDGQGNVSYWVFNPQETGLYSWSEMGAPRESTTSNPSAWVRMVDDFKYLITEAIFSNYAQLGSAIITGDWLLSMNGTIDGVPYENGALFGGKPAYMWFNPADPLGRNVPMGDYAFVPNYCVDLRVGSCYMNGDSYMENAHLRGTLDAVSGTFTRLQCLDRNGNLGGEIHFDPDAREMWFYGHMYHQGSPDGYSPRFLAADVWCRGVFGARERTTLLVSTDNDGIFGVFFSDGIHSQGAVKMYLDSDVTVGGTTFYQIPCYAMTDSGHDYGRANAFPVDTIIINIQDASYNMTVFNLLLADSQRVMVINGNDTSGHAFDIYTNNGLTRWYEGEVAEVIKVRQTSLGSWTFMTPNFDQNDRLGAGVFVGAFRNNSWPQ